MTARPRRDRTRLAILALLAASLAGCSARQEVPSVRVKPAMSVADEALHVRVRGLDPGEVVTVRLQSTDSTGVRWRSSARFRADEAGEIAFEAGAALLLSLRGDRPAARYAWADAAPSRSLFRPVPSRFALTVSRTSRAVASATFVRRGSAGPFATRALSLEENGIVGTFAWPPRQGRRTAILLLGGLDGGVPGGVAPELLAGRGYAVLALAYWAAAGLPRTAVRIPLEYFDRALVWLRAQPQVDPARIVVWGYDRGSEAALLLATRHRGRVRAVVAANPHKEVRCLDIRCAQGPPWTLHGRPLPFEADPYNPYPSPNAAARIPVERIEAPVFLFCGGRASMELGCPSAEAIRERLGERSGGSAPVIHAYPRAGDAIADPVPYVIGRETAGAAEDGYDERGRADVWPRLLRFLGAL